MTPATSPPWFSVAASAQPLLAAAAKTWENTLVSERYIQQALAQPDADLGVLESAYRFYFYKNDNCKALDVAVRVCDRIHETHHWAHDWGSLMPILTGQIDQPSARLYLSAYAASGLLLARLGQIEAAQSVAEQIQQIDAKEFGAELLLNILNTPTEEED